jgi:hypothetical protein
VPVWKNGGDLHRSPNRRRRERRNRPRRPRTTTRTTRFDRARDACQTGRVSGAGLALPAGPASGSGQERSCGHGTCSSGLAAVLGFDVSPTPAVRIANGRRALCAARKDYWDLGSIGILRSIPSRLVAGSPSSTGYLAGPRRHGAARAAHPIFACRPLGVRPAGRPCGAMLGCDESGAQRGKKAPERRHKVRCKATSKNP